MLTQDHCALLWVVNRASRLKCLKLAVSEFGVQVLTSMSEMHPEHSAWARHHWWCLIGVWAL